MVCRGKKKKKTFPPSFSCRFVRSSFHLALACGVAKQPVLPLPITLWPPPCQRWGAVYLAPAEPSRLVRPLVGRLWPGAREMMPGLIRRMSASNEVRSTQGLIGPRLPHRPSADHYTGFQNLLLSVFRFSVCVRVCMLFFVLVCSVYLQIFHDRCWNCVVWTKQWLVDGLLFCQLVASTLPRHGSDLWLRRLQLCL